MSYVELRLNRANTLVEYCDMDGKVKNYHQLAKREKRRDVGISTPFSQ